MRPQLCVLLAAYLIIEHFQFLRYETDLQRYAYNSTTAWAQEADIFSGEEETLEIPEEPTADKERDNIPPLEDDKDNSGEKQKKTKSAPQLPTLEPLPELEPLPKIEPDQEDPQTTPPRLKPAPATPVPTPAPKEHEQKSQSLEAPEVRTNSIQPPKIRESDSIKHEQQSPTQVPQQLKTAPKPTPPTPEPNNNSENPPDESDLPGFLVRDGDGPCESCSSPSHLATISVRDAETNKIVNGAFAALGEQRIEATADGTIAITLGGRQGHISIGAQDYHLAEFDSHLLRTGNAFTLLLEKNRDLLATIGFFNQNRRGTSDHRILPEHAGKVAPLSDAIYVMRYLPGMQGQNLSPDIAVRNSSPRDSKFFWDELYLPFAAHPVAHVSVLAPEIIDSATLRTGGHFASDDEAMGGVLRFASKDSFSTGNHFHTRLSYPFAVSIGYERSLNQSTLDTTPSVNTEASTPTKPVPSSNTSGLRLVGRYGLLETSVRSRIKERGNANLEVIPEFWDMAFVLTQTGKDAFARTTGVCAADSLSISGPGDLTIDPSGNIRMHSSHQFCSVGYHRFQRLHRMFYFSTTPQFTQEKIEFERSIHSAESTIYRFRIPFELKVLLNPMRKIFVGLDPSFNINNLKLNVPKYIEEDPFYDYEDYQPTDIERIDSHPRGGAWLEWEEKLGSLVLRPGGRLLYNGQLKRVLPDPRINGSFEITKNHILDASAGQYSLSPTFYEALKGYGNALLDFESVNQYAIRFQSQWSASVSSGISAYYKEMFLIVTEHPLIGFDNDGEANAFGLELSFKYGSNTNQWFWFNYTFAQLEERSSYLEDWRPGDYDRQHSVNLLFNWRFFNRLDFGGIFHFHTGDTVTFPGETFLNINQDDFTARTHVTDHNAQRQPNFHQFDLHMGTPWQFGAGMLDVRLGVLLHAQKPQVQIPIFTRDYSQSEWSRDLQPIPYFEIRGSI